MAHNPDFRHEAAIAVEGAIEAFRRQAGIMLQAEGVSYYLYPAEFMESESVPANTRLLLSPARMQALGIPSNNPQWFNAESLTREQLVSLIDASYEGKPPALPLAQEAEPEIASALSLAKYAGLLPALLVSREKNSLTEEWRPLLAEHIHVYNNHPLLELLPMAQARLPLKMAENATLTGFRVRYSAQTHLALSIGDLTKDIPLVRVHSSCVTGDILGSLRCDCGDQLTEALAQISAAGSGILLYLHQEGRGIGIINKLRAYRLQEQGFDTYETNRMLGFNEDERDFAVAALMLKQLGVTRVRLLTNNPAKLEALTQHSIKVKERVPLIRPPGEHNAAYLKAKTGAGHLF